MSYKSFLRWRREVGDHSVKMFQGTVTTAGWELVDAGPAAAYNEKLFRVPQGATLLGLWIYVPVQWDGDAMVYSFDLADGEGTVHETLLSGIGLQSVASHDRADPFRVADNRTEWGTPGSGTITSAGTICTTDDGWLWASITADTLPTAGEMDVRLLLAVPLR